MEEVEQEVEEVEQEVEEVEEESQHPKLDDDFFLQQFNFFPI